MNCRVVHDATGVCASLLLGLLALTPAARAQDDWMLKWSNGFSLSSADDAFKLKLGGRIQGDYTFVSEDDALPGLEDGFEFRRARLFFEGTIYERIRFKAQYDFAGGDADFKDVYIGILQDWGEVRFGHYKEYFSLEEQTSSKYLAFIERSLPVEAFSPGRNSGIGVHGKKGDRLNWGFGVFYDADDFGVSSGEDNINITGRLAFRPLYENGGERMVHVGLSATQKELESGGAFRFRARPEAHLSPRFVNTDRFAADRALILDLELAGVSARSGSPVSGSRTTSTPRASAIQTSAASMCRPATTLPASTGVTRPVPVPSTARSRSRSSARTAARAHGRSRSATRRSISTTARSWAAKRTI
jgi:phosphate-selective porin OprO/OprP